MEEKNNYWQAVRGVSILAVVMIHSLGGFDYTNSSCDEFVVLRQIINFAVAVFVFMAAYFVNTDNMLSEKFNYKDYLYKRGGKTVHSVCTLVDVIYFHSNCRSNLSW